MLELLRQSEARRRARLRQELASVAIATALLALGVYGISRLDAPEPRAHAAAGRPAANRAASEGGAPTSGSSGGGAPGRSAAAPSARRAPRPAASTPDAPPTTGGGERATDTTTGSRATNAGEGAAERTGGSAGAADREVRGASSGSQGTADAGPPEPPTELSAEVGVSVAPEALRGSAGRQGAGSGGAAGTRTELALEPADGADGGVTTERLTADSAPAAAGAPRAAGAAREPGDTAAAGTSEGTRGRWRVTARAPGTQRLRVLALDVRDSAGRVDTVARREIATVDVPLGTASGDAAGAAEETPDAPWRGPAVWIVACLLSFVLGWLARGGGRGAAAPASDGVPDAGDDRERRD